MRMKMEPITITIRVTPAQAVRHGLAAAGASLEATILSN